MRGIKISQDETVAKEARGEAVNMTPEKAVYLTTRTQSKDTKENSNELIFFKPTT